MVEQFRKLLSMQVKLDIAAQLRQESSLDEQGAIRAYQKLTTDDRVQSLVRELAYEETQAAVERGDVPSAALLLLAGFRPNPAGDC